MLNLILFMLTYITQDVGFFVLSKAHVAIQCYNITQYLNHLELKRKPLFL